MAGELKGWDRNQMAARGLTVTEIENALRSENVELPAGSFESVQRQFTVRVNRTFRTEEEALSIANSSSSILLGLFR